MTFSNAIPTNLKKMDRINRSHDFFSSVHKKNLAMTPTPVYFIGKISGSVDHFLSCPIGTDKHVQVGMEIVGDIVGAHKVLKS